MALSFSSLSSQPSHSHLVNLAHTTSLTILTLSSSAQLSHFRKIIHFIVAPCSHPLTLLPHAHAHRANTLMQKEVDNLRHLSFPSSYPFSSHPGVEALSLSSLSPFTLSLSLSVDKKSKDDKQRQKQAICEQFLNFFFFLRLARSFFMFFLTSLACRMWTQICIYMTDTERRTKKERKKEVGCFF